MGEMNVRPKDFHISAHIFWMQYALKRTQVLDFLSEAAQRSIAVHLAEAARDFYEYHTKPNSEKGEWNTQEYQKYDNFRYFKRATLEHPLGELFGEKFANIIDKSCVDVYSLLQQGKDPALEDKREQ